MNRGKKTEIASGERTGLHFFEKFAFDLDAGTFGEGVEEDDDSLGVAHFTFEDALESAQGAGLDFDDLTGGEFYRADGDRVRCEIVGGRFAVRADTGQEQFIDNSRLAAEADDVGDSIGVFHEAAGLDGVKPCEDVAGE